MEKPVALITGAAGGIGHCLATDLAKRDFCLMLTDLETTALEERWGSEKQIAVAALDVRDGNNWRQVLDETEKRFGPLDYLFNVAGFLKPGYVLESSEEDMRKHLEINALGAMLGTKYAAESMSARGRGHIVNISSLAGVAPIPGIGLYSASKFALRGFSLAAAQELESYGIAVTVVCPDAVQTPMLDLQVDYDEAALTFSGSKKPLSPQAIAVVIIGRVLKSRPLEVQIPMGRGLLARIGNAFPALTGILGNSLKKKGMKRLQQIRSQKNN